MNSKGTTCIAKRELRLLLALTALIAGVGASSCTVIDTCEGDGTCPEADADAATASDTRSGDAFDSALEDASITEAAPDAFVDGDASEGPVAPPEGGTDATDAGPPPDASPATPFLGSWTLTGTETFLCSTDAPDAPETADPGSITVTFSAGPGPTDAGQVDLVFDDGAQCALTLFVDRGVARLVSAPQTCNLDGRNVYRQFTSVQVTSATGPLPIREIFTDRTACQYQIDGVLKPENQD